MRISVTKNYEMEPRKPRALALGWMGKFKYNLS